MLSNSGVFGVKLNKELVFSALADGFNVVLKAKLLLLSVDAGEEKLNAIGAEVVTALNIALAAVVMLLAFVLIPSEVFGKAAIGFV